jgi:hypothetical protein
MNHAEAIDLIRNTARETFLSYEEAVAVYLRARGFLNDGATELGAPVPEDWSPVARSAVGIPVRLIEPVSDLGVKLCPHCEGAGTFDDAASGVEIECTWCDGTGDYRERGRNFLTVDDV